jgi:PPOX class probable F420-dependent enzyme
MPFSQADRELLDLTAFAQLATLLPDGSPQLTVIWYRRDGDTLRMASSVDAVKTRNIERDPRVAVTVADPGNPYAFIQVRGRAEIIRDDALARAEFRILARRYMGADGGALGTDGDAWADALPVESEFVVIVIHPERTSLSMAG